MVTILSRSAWGAASSRPSSGDPWRSVPRSSRQYFTGHHTVTPKGDTFDGVRAILRNIQAGHFGRGYCDIGYNYLIDQFGNIWEGRGLDIRAAAVGSNNTPTINVAYIGNNNPTEAAKRAYAALRAWVNNQMGRNLSLKGHRDFNSTACPGQNLYDWFRAGMPLAPLNAWDNVSAVQIRLNVHGASLDVDDEYGPLTTAAMSAFQTDHGLTVTGKPDAATWALLALDPVTVPEPEPVPTVYTAWIIPGRMRAPAAVTLVNIITGDTIATYDAGAEFDIAGEVATPDGKRYLMTPYSFGDAEATGTPAHPHGFPANELETVKTEIPEPDVPPVVPPADDEKPADPPLPNFGRGRILAGSGVVLGAFILAFILHSCGGPAL